MCAESEETRAPKNLLNAAAASDFYGGGQMEWLFILVVLAILALIAWFRQKAAGAVLGGGTTGGPSAITIGRDYRFRMDPPPKYDSASQVISGINMDGDPVSFTKEEWCEKINAEVVRLATAGRTADANAVQDNLNEIQRLLRIVC